MASAASAFAASAGAHTDLTLKDTTHTRLEVSYLRQPGGGVFEVAAEGKLLGTVETTGPVGGTRLRRHSTCRRSPGTSQIRVTSGQVRAFGVRFEKPGPGVEYDSLGLNGASFHRAGAACSTPSIGPSSCATCSRTSL